MIAIDDWRNYIELKLELTIKSDDMRVPEHPTFTGCNGRRVG